MYWRVILAVAFLGIHGAAADDGGDPRNKVKELLRRTEAPATQLAQRKGCVRIATISRGWCEEQGGSFKGPEEFTNYPRRLRPGPDRHGRPRGFCTICNTWKRGRDNTMRHNSCPPPSRRCGIYAASKPLECSLVNGSCPNKHFTRSPGAKCCTLQ